MSKSIQSWLVILIISSSCAREIPGNYSYDDFTLEYNRNYTGQERQTHEEIFLGNLAQLRQLRKQGYDLWINKFMDWNSQKTERFFKSKSTNINPPPASPDPMTAAVGISQTLATQHDWRDSGYVTPVKDQGDCGAGTAFATTAQYESLLAIKSKGQKILDLAQQYVFQCDLYSEGCSGGDAIKRIDTMISQGIPLESDYPYNSNMKYSGICSAKDREKLEGNVPYSENSYKIADLERAIVQWGPAVARIAGGNLFFQGVGPSGQVRCPHKFTLDHYVLVFGFNKTHWYIKNSWGTDWGDKGIGYVDKNADCGLRNFVIKGYNNFYNVLKQGGMIPVLITMTDRWGDGWNGNIFAIMQDGVEISTFGETFTSGFTNPYKIIGVVANRDVVVAVKQIGFWTEEVGFVILGLWGQVYYQKKYGTKFYGGKFIDSFCPLYGCPPPSDIVLSFYPTDWNWNGWQGGRLAFKQFGSTVFEGTMTLGGPINGPFNYTFKNMRKVEVQVIEPGQSPYQIGFKFNTSRIWEIYQNFKGRWFTKGEIIDEFCATDQVLPILAASPIDPEEYAKKQKIIKQQQAEKLGLSTATQEQNFGYKVATFILIPVVVLLCLALGISIYKHIKNSKKASKEEDMKQKKSNENATAKTIQTEQGINI